MLTPESQKTLEERREDMLTQAKKCFNEALSKPDNDEPWLQYYMLGKIAEKMCKPPDEYLESYLKVKYECICNILISGLLSLKPIGLYSISGNSLTRCK